jgi:hypothetical protein
MQRRDLPPDAAVGFRVEAVTVGGVHLDLRGVSRWLSTQSPFHGLSVRTGTGGRVWTALTPARAAGEAANARSGFVIGAP